MTNKNVWILVQYNGFRSKWISAENTMYLCVMSKSTQIPKITKTGPVENGRDLVFTKKKNHPQ